MSTQPRPIQRTLMSMLLLTSIVVLLVSTVTSLTYEFLTYRHSAVRALQTLGEVIADNSTAALAFENADDARATLAALKAEPHIIGAVLYDRQGALFAAYPQNVQPEPLSGAPEPPAGYRFEHDHLVGLQPVVQNGRRLGTLYLKSDTRAIFDELRLHGLIAALVIAASCLLAYFMSRSLQRRVSQPILSLAEIAQAVSERRDYSVRAAPAEGYELGKLTEAFNHMLMEIQQQHVKLNVQLGNLQLLQQITRAIG